MATSDKRVRTMTDRGAEHYEETKTSMFNKISRSQNKLESLFNAFEESADIKLSRQNSRDITNLFEKFQNQSKEYVNFLTRVNTDQSRDDLGLHESIFKTVKLRVEQILIEHAIREENILERLSNISSNSNTSVLSRRRAKAESARTRMVAASREMEIRKQRAQIDEEIKHSMASADRKKEELTAELNLLSEQKEVAAVEAELRFLEQEGNIQTRLDLADSIEPMQLTQQYVLEHATEFHDVNKFEPLQPDSRLESLRQSDSRLESLHQTDAKLEPLRQPDLKFKALYQPKFESLQPKFESLHLPQPDSKFEHLRQPDSGFEHLRQPASGIKHLRQPDSGFEPLRQPTFVFEPLRQPDLRFEHLRQPDSGFKHPRQPASGFEPLRQPDLGFEPLRQPDLRFEPLHQPDLRFEPLRQPDLRFEPLRQPDLRFEPLRQPDLRFEPLRQPNLRFEPSYQPNQVYDSHQTNVMNPSSVNFQPVIQPLQSNFTFDVSKFLLKKDLLLSRFRKYDDAPESYGLWKTSFLSIIKELEATPDEELDLLTKWLGPESSKNAMSIRASNCHNADRGLRRIWDRLDERFGAIELVEAAIKGKVARFPKLSMKDDKRLYELSDIVSEIESIKENKEYSVLLSYFDTSSGIIPLVNKLPFQLREKWTTKASSYKQQYRVAYPPFKYFANFIRNLSKIRNDPGFKYDESSGYDRKSALTSQPHNRPQVSVRKTELKSQPNFISKQNPRCPLHYYSHHSINKCRGFKYKSLQERKTFLKDNGICTRCCISKSHTHTDCNINLYCEECGSKHHQTALHVSQSAEPQISSSKPVANHGEEKPKQDISKFVHSPIATKCTQICGDNFNGKSCSKIVLVDVYTPSQPSNIVRVYALLDDQSNRTLGRSSMFNALNIHGEEIEYSLSSCSGNITTYGRRVPNLVIQSLDGKTKIKLPSVIECDEIPNFREEIPTPEITHHYPHLRDVNIPVIDDNAEIALLIGRDVIEAHHVQEHRIGPQNSPYAQHLSLGWVLIGETCLGNIHQPDVVNVNKTYLTKDGYTSIFKPCPNKLMVKENVCTFSDNGIGNNVFARTRQDETPGLSVEDRQFIEIMESAITKNEDGNWVAPLPFRLQRPRLPNNKPQVLNRFRSLSRSLQQNPIKREHFCTFMQKILDNGHAELAPPLDADEECWYLPIFGVYHPKKPGQIRVVFDSSSPHKGISLNDVLLKGPDLTNSLLGVLLRFRTELVAVTADIQQMFHCFKVKESHRNYLRFMWYLDNDPTKDIVEYRMTVHVFGNSSSPSVASFGLHKTAQVTEAEYGSDVRRYVVDNFYVDDGIISLPSESEAIDLLHRTQHALKSGGNLRLHKIVSNSPEVMKAFPSEDLAKDVKDLDLGNVSLPLQRSLGLYWDITKDTFTFQVSPQQNPYTRRGILSTVNSLYDPLGFAAPVTIQGKLQLRRIVSETKDWDEELPDTYLRDWETWRSSLKFLEDVSISRTYFPVSFTTAINRELHIFSDASKGAIAAVGYLRTTDSSGQVHVGFVLGKAKVAPASGHTIPRLELCAAVLAVEMYDIISRELPQPDQIHFYTDSKVVLGYIYNQSRRFYIYVGNRVERIRRSSEPNQWHYVASESNPADQASRSISADKIRTSTWLTGPNFLWDPQFHADDPASFLLVDPDHDIDVRPNTITLKSNLSVVSGDSLGIHRFERFSVWKTLVETIAKLRHIATSFTSVSSCHGWHNCQVWKTVKAYEESELFIIGQVQMSVFGKEVRCLKSNIPLPKDSKVLNLSPFLNKDRLHVGGRLNNMELTTKEKNPLVIPGNSYIAIILVRHYHNKILHQGRHFTEGAIRSAGYWIIGGKRLISSVIHHCVKCRKLRTKTLHQKMADLPSDRLTPSPAFTYVGLDTFGPWSVVSRRTRGHSADSKRWAILFTCLTTRAIHIEVVEELSSSSFINALRRFISLRGPVKSFRSDQGTNFIGAVDDLQIKRVQSFLYTHGSTWIFNPPHSSHMGGVWERMIGVVRRILDSIITNMRNSNFTHEVLVTFMAEVTAIVNSRPITSVSSDPDSPMILTPATLLTQKTHGMPETTFDYLDIKDMYRAQWRCVQVLANTFWNKWRSEYIHSLQPRRKWRDNQDNLRNGDMVLLKDKNLSRCVWNTGLIINAIQSADSHVRKAEVRIIKDGKPVVYTRPITDKVLLLPAA